MCISTRNFPTMKSYIGTAMLCSILLCLLAYQDLVTVNTTFIFFVTFLSDNTMLSSSAAMFPSTNNYEELPAERKKSILIEVMSNDVLSYDVPEKEANMYWHDFTRSMDNMDVINSVKNRNNKQHHNMPEVLSFSSHSNHVFR